MDKVIDALVNGIDRVVSKYGVWLNSSKRDHYYVVSVAVEDAELRSRLDQVMRSQGFAVAEDSQQGTVGEYVLPAVTDRYRSSAALLEWLQSMLPGLGIASDAIVLHDEKLIDKRTHHLLTMVTDEESKRLAGHPIQAWGTTGAVTRAAPPPEGAKWTPHSLNTRAGRTWLAALFGCVSGVVIGSALTSPNLDKASGWRWLLLILPTLIWLVCYVTGDRKRRRLRGAGMMLLSTALGAFASLLQAHLTPVPSLADMAIAIVVASALMGICALVNRWLLNRTGGPVVSSTVTLVTAVLPGFSMAKIAEWSFARGVGVPTSMMNVDPAALAAAFSWKLLLLLVCAAIPVLLVTAAKKAHGDGAVFLVAACFYALVVGVIGPYWVPWRLGDAVSAGNIAGAHGLAQNVCVRESGGKPWRGPFELVPSTRSDLVLLTPMSHSQRLRVEYVSGNAQVETLAGGHC